MNQTLDTGVRGEDGVLWHRRSDPGPDGLGDGVDRVMRQWNLYSHPAIRLGGIGRTWGAEGGDDQADEAAWGDEGLWLNRVGEHVHMHIHLPPPSLYLILYRPLHQPLHTRQTRRILHLILGMILPQSAPELIPRRGPLHGRIEMHTAPTDPELILSAARVVEFLVLRTDGMSEELDLGG